MASWLNEWYLPICGLLIIVVLVANALFPARYAKRTKDKR